MDTKSMQASDARSSGSSIKSRRGWRQMEETVLIEKMKEMVTQGWRSESGFRPGFTSHLEEHMMRMFPGTDIRAKPHIESKIHVWKRQHAGLFTMIGKSGTAWNPDTKMLDVTDEVWNAYGKPDKLLKGLRHRPIPLYPDWCEVFGRDRATGEHAQDFENVINEVNTEQPNQEETAGGTDAEFMSTSDNHAASASNKGKKRKSESSNDGEFIDLIRTLCDRADSRLNEIAKRIGHEHDLSIARKEVFEALCQFPELSQRDKISVGKRLANNPQDLEYFFSLPTSDRLEFVKMILEGSI